MMLKSHCFWRALRRGWKTIDISLGDESGKINMSALYVLVQGLLSHLSQKRTDFKQRFTSNSVSRQRN